MAFGYYYESKLHIDFFRHVFKAGDPHPVPDYMMRAERQPEGGSLSSGCSFNNDSEGFRVSNDDGPWEVADRIDALTDALGMKSG